MIWHRENVIGVYKKIRCVKAIFMVFLYEKLDAINVSQSCFVTKVKRAHPRFFVYVVKYYKNKHNYLL